MTPQNKLYEAAKNVWKVADKINAKANGLSVLVLDEDFCALMRSIHELSTAISAYEQEQPEAITWKKNAYESALDYLSEMGYGTGTNFILKGVASLLADFASQQTSAKDKEITELKERISVIKEKLPDNKIRDLNPIWVRDEIISELEKLI